MFMAGKKTTHQMQVSKHPADELRRLHQFVVAFAALGEFKQDGQKRPMTVALIDGNRMLIDELGSLAARRSALITAIPSLALWYLDLRQCRQSIQMGLRAQLTDQHFE